MIYIFLLATALLHAQKRPVTHEDIFLLKRTGEAAPSPDGKWVVFSVTEPDYDTTKTVSDLWIVPVDGSAPARRLTSSTGSESGVACGQAACTPPAAASGSASRNVAGPWQRAGGKLVQIGP